MKYFIDCPRSIFYHITFVPSHPNTEAKRDGATSFWIAFKVRYVDKNTSLLSQADDQVFGAIFDTVPAPFVNALEEVCHVRGVVISCIFVMNASNVLHLIARCSLNHPTGCGRILDIFPNSPNFFPVQFYAKGTRFEKGAAMTLACSAAHPWIAEWPCVSPMPNYIFLPTNGIISPKSLGDATIRGRVFGTHFMRFLFLGLTNSLQFVSVFFPP